MVLLNGSPVRNPRSMLYDALRASGLENKNTNDEVVLNVSGNVYIVERNGTDIILVPASVSNSSSYNTQTVAANEAIVIVGAGVIADNESMTSVTQPSTDDGVSSEAPDSTSTEGGDGQSSTTASAEPTSTTVVDTSTTTLTDPSTDDVTDVSDDGVTVVSDSSTSYTQSVSPSDATTVDGQDGVSSEAPDTTSTESGDDQSSTTEPTEPPKENVTTDCNINVVIIVFPGTCGSYPCGQMQPAYGASPFLVLSRMYQLPHQHDMFFRAAMYDAPLAARAYEALNTAQSQTANQKSRVSVHLNGGYCYQFTLMKNPTSAGLPYNIMDVTPIRCPNGVFP
ncbi:hypothetical protein P879_07911 [Paragonimus westermani]|uniref:Uncharacterized protein n=1 Tax=Paragonimus westermani TaxID=34504 RepID=A0A8T0DJL2_9TREM|nr:hypothetical protein P879_07911 [Paragonimus westermani]